MNATPQERESALIAEIRALRAEVQQLHKEARPRHSFEARFGRWLKDQHAQAFAIDGSPDDHWRARGQPGAVVTALLRVGPDGQASLDVWHGPHKDCSFALITPEMLLKRAMPTVLTEARQFLGLDRRQPSGGPDADAQAA